MNIHDFDFALPEELIAQCPAEKRDHSRLLTVDVAHHTYEDHYFYDIVDFLKPGDVLVRNNTKVLPARLLGEKEQTHAHVEVLLLKQIEKDVWECLTGNAKTIKEGTRVRFGDGQLVAECVRVLDEGIRHFRMIYDGIFYEVLDTLGKMPLPPYIKTQYADNSRYQTVYAKIEGSAAAPTAGFHFTEELFETLRAKGVIITDVTLHIGLGTFRPVKVEEIQDHPMHAESYWMSEETAQILQLAKKEHRRIIAIGTTSTRVLESVIKQYGRFQACAGETNIFIYPGYHFSAIDALITNFHLPKSTLVMLVSALAGREFIMEVYQHAIEARYRFFSFGDAMFIDGKAPLL